MKPSRSQLFSKSGHPIKGLACALSRFDCATLEDLVKLVERSKDRFDYDVPHYITLPEIYRTRGNGNCYNPGLLARYLFDVPSREEAQRERVASDMGAGI